MDMQLQGYSTVKGQPTKMPKQSGYATASYSTKNVMNVQGDHRQYAAKPQQQLTFSGSQTQLTGQSNAASRYSLQHTSEALIKKKRGKVNPSVRDQPDFAGVPYGGSRYQASDDQKSHPVSMKNVSNYQMNASRNYLDNQSKSISGLTNYSNRQLMAADGFLNPFLDATASNTAAMTTSHHFMASAEAIALSASGSKFPSNLNQEHLMMSRPIQFQYQNNQQVIAAKNMERLKKGRAQSAVKRDQMTIGSSGRKNLQAGLDNFASAQPQIALHDQYQAGPFTNPNIMQAYHHQDLINSSYLSNISSQGQNFGNNQFQQDQTQVGSKVKPQRPTSAAIRPGPRTLQDRQKIIQNNQIAGAQYNHYDDQSAVYGLPQPMNQFGQHKQMTEEAMAAMAQMKASKENVNDTNMNELPSQGSVDGILTVLNQFRNRNGGNSQNSLTIDNQQQIPNQDLKNRYSNEDFVQLGQNREQFQYPAQSNYSKSAANVKFSRNQGGHYINSFPAGIGRVDSGASQYASAKRITYQQNRQGVPSEVGSGVTRHTIASSEKRKLPLRPTTAQQRSRLAFAIHGLTQKESVEELAEKEMMGIETQFSHANISLANTNQHGQSHTRLSSGRTSQIFNSRPKFTPYQSKSIFATKIHSSHVANNSKKRKVESALMQKRGKKTFENYSPSHGQNMFSQGVQEQSGYSKITPQQLQSSAPYLGIKSQAALSNRQRPRTAAIGRAQRANQLRTTTGTMGMSASYLDQSQNTDQEINLHASIPEKIKQRAHGSKQKEEFKRKGVADKRASTILSSRGGQKIEITNSQPTKPRQQRVTIADSKDVKSEKIKKFGDKKLMSMRPQTANRDTTKQPYDINLLSQIFNNETKGLLKDNAPVIKIQRKKSSSNSPSVPGKKSSQVQISEPGSANILKTNSRTALQIIGSQRGKFPNLIDKQKNQGKSDKLMTQTSFENTGALDMKLAAVQSDTIQQEDNQSQEKSMREINCLTRSMQDHNNIVTTYLSVLEQMQESNPAFRGIKMSKSMAGVDCQAKLIRASQDMKAIRFHCHNLVSRDEDRLHDIKVTSRGDATRGPDNKMDLIKNCPLFCRIHVKGRKQPIKIYFRQNDQFPSLSEFGDLKICLSDHHKNPTLSQCVRTYQNPGSCLTLQDPSEWPELKDSETNKKEEKDKLAVQDSYQNLFTTEDLYISFISEKNCELNVMAQFPKELGMDDDNPKNKERTNIRSEKALRAKFADFIQIQIRELASDVNKRDKYFGEISEMKHKMQRPTLRSNETDFRALNVLLARNLLTHLRNQSMARQEIDNKIEEARLRRDVQEEERLEQLRFEAIKWDLYRMRVEQIEDDYADFKRLQKKINMWLFIALRHIAVKLIFKTFKTNQQRVLLHRKKTIMHFRICRIFRNYLKVKGSTYEQRLEYWPRDSFSFAGPTMIKAQRKKAIKLIHAFLKTESVYFNIKKKLENVRNMAIFIKLNIKKMIINRQVRTQIIDDFFEKEVSIMKKYYNEKSKKAKKFRVKYQALCTISKKKKQELIKAYMKKISYQNMIHQMYYQANLYLQQGERPDGKLSEDEYQIITSLMLNLKRVQTYLFDGIKENEPVGQHFDEHLKLNPQTEQLLGHLKDLANIKPGCAIPISIAHSHAEASGPGTSSHSPTRQLTRKESLDSRAGMDLLDDLEEGDVDGDDGAGANEGTGGGEEKKKSESKGKGKSSGGGKKGGGKKGKKSSKKAKTEDEVELDWTIPKDKDSPCLFLFIPDRQTMQMIINRALNLKDWDRMPELEEIRPWIKIKNRDVLYGSF